MASPEKLLHDAILASPLLRSILAQWDRVALPDAWLVAGAVAQTYWNHSHGLAPGHGIKDVDIVYFDGTDLSQETEAAHEARINAVFADCGVKFDVKNEARVHLWYAQKFGYAIRPYVSSEQAIATFPTTATAVGVRPRDTGVERLEFCAPYGLSDLVGLVARPNKAQITQEIYATKIRRWRSLWPQLRFVEWNEALTPGSPPADSPT
jgi:hypothetical protein